MPARDGAGWLLRIFPEAPAILIVLELLTIAYCLFAILRHREQRISGEEKILLFFCCFALLLPTSMLIGISAWFATQSVTVGIGAGVSLFIGAIAFMRKD
ncbi:MAG: hypothetical protein SGJ27_26540 [Candidatus Melainabacteria bacterium]|nr:hypothetical protein [Candidatus Melainabacteria bacterium]